MFVKKALYIFDTVCMYIYLLVLWVLLVLVNIAVMECSPPPSPRNCNNNMSPVDLLVS